MTIFEYAFGIEENFFKKNLRECGYEPFTTFYSDLTLAELVEGKKGVQETITNVLNNWMSDIKYITEFCMAVNYKSLEMNARLEQNQTKINGRFDIAELGEFYSNQYYQVKDAIIKHYTDVKDALNYFFNTID